MNITKVFNNIGTKWIYKLSEMEEINQSLTKDQKSDYFLLLTATQKLEGNAAMSLNFGGNIISNL